MCLKLTVLALTCIGGLAAQRTSLKKLLSPSAEIVTGTVQQDQLQPQASGFITAAAQPAPVLAGGKYFQYIHVPAKDHYEHGHKKGNHHHFIERHEKGHPHAGEFKTKVRWGDKHGGYGEHLWDYNHAGNGDNGEESQQHDSYESYEETKQSPVVVAAATVPRGKRNPDEEVEFIDDKARQLHHSGRMAKHGGNYRRAPDEDYRAKRQPDLGGLYLDGESGYVVDGATGDRYQLSPVRH